MTPWMTATVGIRVTTERPDNDAPWQSSTSTSTGTGVVIARNQVLCAASLVEDAAQVHVWRHDRSGQGTAAVKAIDHECDLALLEVAGYIADIAPVEIAAMPELNQELTVLNCSKPDDGLVVVRGVVSKIGVLRYSHSQRYLLGITIDAAVTAGTGPVFFENGLAGLAMGRDDATSVDLVPPPMIRAFIARVRTNIPAGVPALGFTTQNLENPQLRKLLGLSAKDHGVVVINVDHGGSADGVLQVDDIITAIDGLPIADNGLVTYMFTYAVRYDVVLCEFDVGERLKLDIRRGGRPTSVEIALKPWMPLVPRGHVEPRFFIFGGLVFQRLTRAYLGTWNTWWNEAPKEFLNAYYLGVRTAEQHELVILTQILEDDINIGYAHLYNEGIARINGKLPRDLQDFVTQLVDATGIVRIETTTGGVVALDADEVRAATPRILTRYRIPFAGSPELS